MDVSHLGKHDRRDTNVLVEVMGRFKREDGDRMHITPLENVTSSGIRIGMWLERLVDLLEKEGNTNCPAFCDMEGYMLSAAAIESMFHLSDYGKDSDSQGQKLSRIYT